MLCQAGFIITTIFNALGVCFQRQIESVLDSNNYYKILENNGIRYKTTEKRIKSTDGQKEDVL